MLGVHRNHDEIKKLDYTSSSGVDVFPRHRHSCRKLLRDILAGINSKESFRQSTCIG